MQRVPGVKGKHGQNVLHKLRNLIEKFIHDPSLIRNKLAHGQWAVALNRENSALNEEITEDIKAHNVVLLYQRKDALEKLAAILEDIIESPSKAHHRDYWSHMVDLEQQQEKMGKWTFEKKVEQLIKKKSYST